MALENKRALPRSKLDILIENILFSRGKQGGGKGPGPQVSNPRENGRICLDYDRVIVAGSCYCRGVSDLDTERNIEALAAYLAGRDAVCPGCGYNLRGLKVGRCPECDEALQLQVGLCEPRLGLFITGIAGLASGFGFHLFVLAWFVYEDQYSLGTPWYEISVLLISLGVLGTLLLGWVRMRRRFRRLGVRGRIALASFAWGVSALSAVAFFWLVDA